MRVAMFLSSSLALLADVAPEPGRPAWDHTPLPPPELLIACVLVLGLSWLALAKRPLAGPK